MYGPILTGAHVHVTPIATSKTYNTIRYYVTGSHILTLRRSEFDSPKPHSWLLHLYVYCSIRRLGGTDPHTPVLPYSTGHVIVACVATIRTCITPPAQVRKADHHTTKPYQAVRWLCTRAAIRGTMQEAVCVWPISCRRQLEERWNLLISA